MEMAQCIFISTTESQLVDRCFMFGWAAIKNDSVHDPETEIKAIHNLGEDTIIQSLHRVRCGKKVCNFIQQHLEEYCRNNTRIKLFNNIIRNIDYDVLRAIVKLAIKQSRSFSNELVKIKPTRKTQRRCERVLLIGPK